MKEQKHIKRHDAEFYLRSVSRIEEMEALYKIMPRGSKPETPEEARLELSGRTPRPITAKKLQKGKNSNG